VIDHGAAQGVGGGRLFEADNIPDFDGSVPARD
jgi:hypothetical protein